MIPSSKNNDGEWIPGFEAHYLELWKVAKGERIPKLTTLTKTEAFAKIKDLPDGIKSNDLYFYLGEYASKGWKLDWKIEGNAYYFDGVTLPTDKFKPGGDSNAVYLPSFSLPKSESIFTYFTKDSLTEPSSHNLTITADCREVINKTTIIDRVPKN